MSIRWIYFILTAILLCCFIGVSNKKYIAEFLIQVPLDKDTDTTCHDLNIKKQLSYFANKRDLFEIDGLYSPYRVKYLKDKILHGKCSNGCKINIQRKLAYQYLLAGNVDDAITLLQSHYNRSNSVAKDLGYSLYYKFKSYLFATSMFNQNWGNPSFQLGLSYLRKGEQENCRVNNASTSCIIPFTDEAIHIKKEYSSRAKKHFLDYLNNCKICSSAESAKWLLNIASVTLGEYPEKVPNEFHIDFSKYSSKTDIQFENKANQLGVDMLSLYGSSCVEDFNNDGYLDLFSSSADLNTNVVMYYSNAVDGFVEITNNVGLDSITGGVNVVQGDYNNDGFIDLYLIRGGWMNREGKKHPNSLLKNNGDGTFTDVTCEAGLFSKWSTHTACWGDVNNDGYIDLFVGNELSQSHLFLNLGNGTFNEVSKESELILNEYVKGASWIDYDNDNDLDLYVSTYIGDNHLFENTGIKFNTPMFRDVSSSAGVKEPFYSFPVAVFDFNNDGFEDIFCADFRMNLEEYVSVYQGVKESDIHPRLYINNGDGTFTDEWLKFSEPRQTLSMGINVADVNNDGFLDIYLGTGYPDLVALVPNLLFMNNEGASLSDVSEQSGVAHLQKGHGVAFGDTDNDGDVDMYISMGGWFYGDKYFNAFFQNSGNCNDWCTLKLKGVRSNRSAIGAKVKIVVDNGDSKRTIWRTVGSGGSYGASSLQLEVGLGSIKGNKIDSLEILWPNLENNRQLFLNVPINKKISITEGENSITIIEDNYLYYRSPEKNKHTHH